LSRCTCFACKPKDNPNPTGHGSFPSSSFVFWSALSPDLSNRRASHVSHDVIIVIATPLASYCGKCRRATLHAPTSISPKSSRGPSGSSHASTLSLAPYPLHPIPCTLSLAAYARSI
jgi:hypothetical protein